MHFMLFTSFGLFLCLSYVFCMPVVELKCDKFEYQYFDINGTVHERKSKYFNCREHNKDEQDTTSTQIKPFFRFDCLFLFFTINACLILCFIKPKPEKIEKSKVDLKIENF